MSEFSGQRVAVIGLAATGVAVAGALARRGALVTVLDARPLDRLFEKGIEALETLGVAIHAGNDALPREADLVVPSPGVPRTAPPLAEALARGLPIWSEIEVGYRIARAPILAITGTNGKTTTTAMLGAICQEAGLETFVCGNIAEDNGVRTPLVAAAEQAGADAVLVAEISSFQLEWVQTFRPRVAAWLNLTVDHQDRYAGLGEYAADKAKILNAQTPAEFAVLNADDSWVVKSSEGVGAGRREWFSGANPPARSLKVPGKHNRANAEAAARMARAFGVPEEAIERALGEFPGVAHRMELVRELGGVRWINNSMCTNPAAVRASLEAAREAGGRLFVIVGGRHKGGDLAEMALALQSLATRTLVIGEAAPLLAETLGDDVDIAGTLDRAVQMASESARPGDTVILAPGCASFDQFASFEARGQAFRSAVFSLGSTKKISGQEPHG